MQINGKRQQAEQALMRWGFLGCRHQLEYLVVERGKRQGMALRVQRSETNREKCKNSYAAAMHMRPMPEFPEP